MASMVEKVAQALWEAGWQTPWSDVDTHTKELTYDQARAAIEAMREPTEEMVVAGAAEKKRLGLSLDVATFRLGWRAMIDAALTEQGG